MGDPVPLAKTIALQMTVKKTQPLATEPGVEGLSTNAWRPLLDWNKVHGRHPLPWRQERTPWRVLVAETLLHRTRAGQAAALYEQAVSEFEGPADVLARPERWLELTRSGGLFWRAQKFVEACELLIA